MNRLYIAALLAVAPSLAMAQQPLSPDLQIAVLATQGADAVAMLGRQAKGYFENLQAVTKARTDLQTQFEAMTQQRDALNKQVDTLTTDQKERLATIDAVTKDRDAIRGLLEREKTDTDSVVAGLNVHLQTVNAALAADEAKLASLEKQPLTAHSLNGGGGPIPASNTPAISTEPATTPSPK